MIEIKDAQEWLNEKHPTLEKRRDIQTLKIGNDWRTETPFLLKGELKLDGFVHLEQLKISGLEGNGQELELIDLSGCQRLRSLSLNIFKNVVTIKGLGGIVGIRKIETDFCHFKLFESEILKQEIVTREVSINKLQEQLQEIKEKLTTYLTQRKSSLTHEIQLIKEALND